MIKRSLSWIILGLIFYMMLQSGGSKNPALPSPENVTAEATVPAAAIESAAPTAEPVVKQETAFDKAADLERWKRAINPDYAARFECSLSAPKTETDTPQLFWKVTEEKEGAGSMARCSHTITVKLTFWNAQGKVAYTTHAQIQLGTKQIAAGLDAALVGIRKDGVRTVILGPQALDRSPDAKLSKELTAALGKGHMVVVTVEREL